MEPTKKSVGQKGIEPIGDAALQQQWPETTTSSKLGPLHPGRIDEIRTLLVTGDDVFADRVIDAIETFDGLTIQVLRVRTPNEIVTALKNRSPQVVLLHIQDYVGKSLRLLSRIWKQDPTLAVVTFLEPILQSQASFIREPGLDVLAARPLDTNELIWSLRHASEWSTRRRLERHLTYRDRLAVAGQLAASIVHDINNPLMAAKTNLDLVSETLCSTADLSAQPLDQIRESIADARTGVQLAQRIARDLTDFSRAPEDHHDPIDVRKVLQACITLCAPQIRHRARLTRQMNPVPLVRADSSRLCQVFVNLVINAVQAIAPGDSENQRIEIHTRHRDRQVIIEIKDSGCGIPEDKIKQIFEAYYTTKPMGEGTGLGMHLSRSYIHLIGGELDVESTVGVGTTMRITLQATQGIVGEKTPIPEPVSETVNPSKILVVDDEALIRRAFIRALSKRHHIVTARSGEETLDILESGQRFDILFSDIMMPGMDGMQLFKRIEAQWPEQAERIVFMTGGAFGDEVPAFFEQVSNVRVTKNLSLNELRALVHRLEKGTA